MTEIDQSKPIRQGEELDTAVIEAFLKDNIPGLDGSLKLTQFPGGHSNLTYHAQIGEREFVLRRPPFGTKAKTAHDMGREYRIQKALRPVYPYCPEPLAYTEDESIMGCPFYVMERIRGLIVRGDFPDGMKLAPDQVRSLYSNLLDVQIELHKLDYKALGLENFGKPEGYVKRQVEGWSKRYRAARTPDVPDCEAVMAWLAEKMPPDFPDPALIHNDFRLDNAVLDLDDPLRVIGVLDWEMATLGDPLMDLGGSMAYWVQADDPEEFMHMKMQPSLEKGAPTREEQVRMYAERTGWNVDNFDFYYIFGLFRLGVIAQQIYYRFYHGQTTDQRFQRLAFAVGLLDNQAKWVIAKSDL